MPYTYDGKGVYSREDTIMNHTPTPWTYDRFNGRIFRSTLDAPIANCATEANGNHIVHCVNTHAQLVEALEKILIWDDGNLPGDILDEARKTLTLAKK